MLPIIRTLIVDDHARFRRNLKVFLASEPDIEVVGEATNGQEAISHAEKLRPDLVLMDIRMPGMSGLETIQRLKKVRPQLKTIVLTAFGTPEHRRAAIACGADAFMSKAAIAEMLPLAIHLVMRTVPPRSMPEG